MKRTIIRVLAISWFLSSCSGYSGNKGIRNTNLDPLSNMTNKLNYLSKKEGILKKSAKVLAAGLAISAIPTGNALPTIQNIQSNVATNSLSAFHKYQVTAQNDTRFLIFGEESDDTTFGNSDGIIVFVDTDTGVPSNSAIALGTSRNDYPCAIHMLNDTTNVGVNVFTTVSSNGDYDIGINTIDFNDLSLPCTALLSTTGQDTCNAAAFNGSHVFITGVKNTNYAHITSFDVNACAIDYQKTIQITGSTFTEGKAVTLGADDFVAFGIAEFDHHGYNKYIFNVPPGGDIVGGGQVASYFHTADDPENEYFKLNDMTFLPNVPFGGDGSICGVERQGNDGAFWCVNALNVSELYFETKLNDDFDGTQSPEVQTMNVIAESLAGITAFVTGTDQDGLGLAAQILGQTGVVFGATELGSGTDQMHHVGGVIQSGLGTYVIDTFQREGVTNYEINSVPLIAITSGPLNNTCSDKVASGNLQGEIITDQEQYVAPVWSYVNNVVFTVDEWSDLDAARTTINHENFCVDTESPTLSPSMSPTPEPTSDGKDSSSNSGDSSDSSSRGSRSSRTSDSDSDNSRGSSSFKSSQSSKSSSSSKSVTSSSSDDAWNKEWAEALPGYNQKNKSDRRAAGKWGIAITVIWGVAAILLCCLCCFCYCWWRNSRGRAHYLPVDKTRGTRIPTAVIEGNINEEVTGFQNPNV